jgi:DNA-directed RNA polymerase specialized sigma24 family protein
LPDLWLLEFRKENARLHGRSLEGDRPAADEICQRLFFHLTECCRGPREEEGWADAVADALLLYYGQPAAVDPSRGPVDIHLYWIARRFYSHGLRSAARQKKREAEKISAFFLQKGSAAGYLYVEDDADPRQAREKLHRLIAGLKDPIERTFILMRLEGIDDSAEYFKVLIAENPRLAGAAPEVLKHEVSKAMDRAMHKLRYWAQQLDE